MATTLPACAHSLKALFEYLYFCPDSLIPVWSTGGGLADQKLVTSPKKHLSLKDSTGIFLNTLYVLPLMKLQYFMYLGTDLVTKVSF